MIYFQGGELIIENYITRQTFHGSQDTLLVLKKFSRWRTVHQVARELRDFSLHSIVKTVQNLRQHGLLIVKDSLEDRFEKKFSKWWLWPVPARYYHFSTRLEVASTSNEVRDYYGKHLRGRVQPDIYMELPGSKKIKLGSASGHDAPLFLTLRRRKTAREFTGGPVDSSQISKIIFYTWGQLSTYQTKEFGTLLHKSSPSAGARHPIEAYAVINNVKGLSPGLYHYSVRDHSLELLKAGDFRDECVKFAAGQEWTRNTSAFFIMTAKVSRTAWKYRTARVYRAFLLDAGHLSQSFLLASTALGLGAFCIGIISDIAIEKALKIDGVNEIALFAVGVGQPVKSEQNHPPTKAD